jgi:intracellular septation protein A
MWLIAAAAPQFLASALWGDRLLLTRESWRSIGRTVALFFLILGCLNLLVSKTATIDLWVSFKVLAPLLLLMLSLALVSVRLRKANRVP